MRFLYLFLKIIQGDLMNKKLNICKRLLQCADLVTPQSRVADVGTDHAYLPIYLTLQNKISHAIACDLRDEPLNIAKSNIKLFGLENSIETRISDGLKNINQGEVDTIIIAGMGGNLISKILQECTWENKNQKEFILQPMKYENVLRIYLAQQGYKIQQEVAVRCSGKVYTVLKATFTSQSYTLSPLQIYTGFLSPAKNEDAKFYFLKILNDLNNRKKGAIIKNDEAQKQYYSKIIEELNDILSTQKGDMK